MKKILLIASVLYLAGCSSNNSTKSEATTKKTFVSIAAVGGTDKRTQQRVTSVLKSSGIDSYMEGSVVDGVFVPEEDALRAIKILKADAAIKKYWIKFTEELDKAPKRYF